MLLVSAAGVILHGGMAQPSHRDVLLPAHLLPQSDTASMSIDEHWHPRERLLRLLTGAVMTYLIGMFGHTAARALFGVRRGWLELLDDFEPWEYLPGPLLVLLGAMLRSRKLTLAGLPACLMFALRWGPRYLRQEPSAAHAAADVTFMTFNTLAWQRAGHDLAESIVEANPDVVGLQEIGPHATEYLERILADRYPYRFVTPSADSHGAAVFSRFPIRSPRAFQGSEHGHWWQQMTLATPFGAITYLNIHTKIPYVRTWRRRLGPIALPRSYHADRREAEIGTLVALLERLSGPVIVGGDFNMTEHGADYTRMANRLRDAYKAVGLGLGHTFPAAGRAPRKLPAPLPVIRIDYVWHSDHFEPVWARVGKNGRSDHHPVVVGLRWSSEQQIAGDGTLPLAAQAV